MYIQAFLSSYQYCQEHFKHIFLCADWVDWFLQLVMSCSFLPKCGKFRHSLAFALGEIKLYVFQPMFGFINGNFPSDLYNNFLYFLGLRILQVVVLLLA